MGNSRMAVAAYTGQVVSKKTKCPEVHRVLPGNFVVFFRFYPWKRIFPWFFRGYHRFHYEKMEIVCDKWWFHWWFTIDGTWGICFRGVFEEKGWILPWRTWRMVYWRWKMVLLPRKGVKIPSIMVNLPRNMVILPWKTCDFTQTHAEFTKKQILV